MRSAQELVKCVECAASVTQFDVRDDLDEFLAALEKFIAIEHAADDVLRAFRRWLILENTDQRQTMLLRELSQALVWGFLSQALIYTILHFLHSSFFVRLGIPFLRPDPHTVEAVARMGCQGRPSR